MDDGEIAAVIVIVLVTLLLFQLFRKSCFVVRNAEVRRGVFAESCSWPAPLRAQTCRDPRAGAL